MYASHFHKSAALIWIQLNSAGIPKALDGVYPTGMAFDSSCIHTRTEMKKKKDDFCDSQFLHGVEKIYKTHVKILDRKVTDHLGRSSYPHMQCTVAECRRFDGKREKKYLDSIRCEIVSRTLRLSSSSSSR